jgi:hypothetical protein
MARCGHRGRYGRNGRRRRLGGKCCGCVAPLLRVLLHVKSLGINDVAGVAGFSSATCMRASSRFHPPPPKAVEDAGSRFEVAESERTTDIGMSGQAVNRRYAWLRVVTDKENYFLIRKSGNHEGGSGNVGRRNPWHNAARVGRFNPARKREVLVSSDPKEGAGSETRLRREEIV